MSETIGTGAKWGVFATRFSYEVGEIQSRTDKTVRARIGCRESRVPAERLLIEFSQRQKALDLAALLFQSRSQQMHAERQAVDEHRERVKRLLEQANCPPQALGEQETKGSEQ